MSPDFTPPLDAIILLVDDDELARRTIKTILQRNGFTRTLEANNGIHALLLLQDLGEAIDLIVTDVQMPEMDGIALVLAIKRETPNIPVVYVSGYPRPEGLTESEPYCEFVRKPFLPKTLVAAVRKCLSNPTTVPAA